MFNRLPQALAPYRTIDRSWKTTLCKEVERHDKDHDSAVMTVLLLGAALVLENPFNVL